MKVRRFAWPKPSFTPSVCKACKGTALDVDPAAVVDLVGVAAVGPVGVAVEDLIGGRGGSGTGGGESSVPKRDFRSGDHGETPHKRARMKGEGARERLGKKDAMKSRS